MKKKDHVGSKVGGEDGWGRETGGEKIETTVLEQQLKKEYPSEKQNDDINIRQNHP